MANTATSAGASSAPTILQPVEESSPGFTRGDRFFSEVKPVEISPELLDLTTKAFAKPPAKEKWKELLESYPAIKSTESFLVAPTMEAGMKEELRKRHGYVKTKDTLAFDDGLAEKQATYISVARPILAALMALDTPPDGNDEGGIDPDTVKDILEDALVMLGNANARLNEWRQRRFSDYLTDIGRRTIREGIPTDKHLFPHKFHEKIRSEHDHSASNMKLISKPKETRPFVNRSQPFRNPAHFKRGQSSFPDRKRKWYTTNRSGGPSTKRNKSSGGSRASTDTNRSADS